MKWRFSPIPSEFVETEITQRDHFNNDEVNLSETIVREAVQNSLDAARDKTITVSFSMVKRKDGLDPFFFKSIFEGQLEQAKHSDLNIDELDFENPCALIIEDFGTEGLTGNVSEKDSGNFSDFWRRHGKSHKSGSKRGRWGLGKLVYSTSSQAGLFFGVTKRDGDSQVHLMGQTVLNSRIINDKLYPPHAFFADYLNEDDPHKRIPIPVKDRNLIASFLRNFRLDREDKSGLSIVIPFPDESFEKDKMVGVAIENYFYPIITGQLIIKIDEIEINEGNIKELAVIYAQDMFPHIELLFEFIEEAYKFLPESLLKIDPSWISDGLLDEKDFSEHELLDARAKYNSGETVGVELPVELRKRDKRPEKSYFRVFIKKPYDLAKGMDIYVRGGLTLPGESKFKERKALGAMIAEDECICDMLGDAENAAHTQWTMRTEKLSKNYIAPGPIVGAIKKSILSLYKVLADVADERDENALLNFFWYKDPEVQKKKSKKIKKIPDVPPIPKGIPKLKLTKSVNGFSVSNAGGLTEDLLPFEQKVRAAYDSVKGNPFNKYSPLDFTVGQGGSVDTKTEGDVTIVEASKNEWKVRINSLPFRFSVSGFDSNRDLIVRLPEGKPHAEKA